MGFNVQKAVFVAFVFVILACDRPSGRDSTSAGGPRTGSSLRSGAPKLASGSAAGAFRLKDLSGKSVSLESYRGKVVLLNFWATWCAPCVAEMPALERLYKTHKDKGFEVVAVTVDPASSKEDIEKFVEKNGLTFAVLLDPDIALPPEYGVTAFPESFFIDKEGRFLGFLDPMTKTKEVRIVSDRQWDAPAYVKAIANLLESQSS